MIKLPFNSAYPLGKLTVPILFKCVNFIAEYFFSSISIVFGRDRIAFDILTESISNMITDGRYSDRSLSIFD